MCCYEYISNSDHCEEKYNLAIISIFFVPLLDGPDNVAIKGDKQALVGHSVMINCSFASYPVPTFVWKFNDSVLLGETNSCLTITNFEYKNSGIYTCEASNSITGLKKSATHNLTVKGKNHAPDCPVAVLLILLLLLLLSDIIRWIKL